MNNRLKRIALIQWEVVKEIGLHNHWFQLCVSGLLLFVVLAQMLTELPVGASAPKLLFDIGYAAIQSVSGLALVLVLAHQVTWELKDGVVYGYLVRRVSRAEYLLGKILGCWLTLVVLVLVADGLLAWLVHREVAGQGAFGTEIGFPPMAAWIQLYFFQTLHLLVLACLTACMVSLSTSFLFAALTTLLLWGIGLLLTGTTETSSTQGMVGVITEAGRWLIPRFEVWELADTIWYEGSVGWVVFIRGLLLAGLYGAILTGTAVTIFNKRDL